MPDGDVIEIECNPVVQIFVEPEDRAAFAKLKPNEPATIRAYCSGIRDRGHAPDGEKSAGESIEFHAAAADDKAK